jgi:hypothetical protein
MKTPFVVFIILSSLLLDAPARAQIAPLANSNLGLSRANLQAATVRGDGTPVSLIVPVSSPTADDLLDIINSDSATRISLILPDTTEVVPADGASSHGLTFIVYAAPDDASDDSLSTLMMPGSHVVVQFSTAAPVGQYTIKAIGSSRDSVMRVIYLPSSGVSVAAATDSSSYHQGDIVILSALIFDGTVPIKHASVQATIGALMPVQGTIRNYVLTNQQQTSSTITRYSYTADFTAGASATSVIGTVSTSDAHSQIVADTVSFGDISIGSVVTSQSSFIIERPTGTALDPSTLQWKISSRATPATVALLDSGPYDHATGDGIFTGTFTPPAIGNYTAFITVSSGSPRSERTASTSFTVTPIRARFASFHENVAYAADGSIDRIIPAATINVSQSGTYCYEVQLKAGNGRTIRASGTSDLIAGTQDIVLQSAAFSAHELIPLGVDGPWERVEARLTYSPKGDAELADYRADAGATSAYSLLSIHRNPPYLTGQNYFQGIDANSVSGFKLLRAQIGVFTSGGPCYASASLVSSSGKRIDFATTNAVLPKLTASYLVFDFNGAKIARSRDRGPFTIDSFSADCINGGSPLPIPISGFAASQFESQPMGIRLTVSPSLRAVVPGGQATYNVSMTSLEGFSDPAKLSISGLMPRGAVATFAFQTMHPGGATGLNIRTSPSTPPGTYPLTITAQGGAVVGTATTNLVVAAVSSPPPGNSITPGSASGIGDNFVLTAVAPRAGTKLVSAKLVLGPGGYGPGRCFIYYLATTARIYLANDTGSSWVGSAALGDSSITLSNSQCSLYPGQSSVLMSMDGTWLQLTVKVTFKSALQGSYPWNLSLMDTSSRASDWTQIGNYTIRPSIRMR